MSAKKDRCPSCRGAGYTIRNGVGAGCQTCAGTGLVPGGADIPAAVRALLRQRSGGICEVCHAAPATDDHHRLFRSRGGWHVVENLLHLCGPGNVFGCHGDAHGASGEFIAAGVSLSRYESRPLTDIPFVDRFGVSWLLNADGTKERKVWR